MAALDRDDLNDLRDVLSAQMTAGFRAMNDRLDVLNGRTRANEQKIAVLDDRSSNHPGRGVTWTAGISAVVAALLEGLHMWYASK